MTLSKIVVVLTFQLKNYLHVEHQSYLNEFIDEIRRFIQRIIINRLRFFVVKLINKEIKINSFSLSSYFFEWSLNKITFRRNIEKFRKIIVDYKINFLNFKFRSSNDNNFSFIESFNFKTRRFQFQFSKKKRAFFFITSTLKKHFSSISFSNLSVRRFKSISISNIKSIFDLFVDSIIDNRRFFFI